MKASFSATRPLRRPRPLLTFSSLAFSSSNEPLGDPRPSAGSAPKLNALSFLTPKLEVVPNAATADEEPASPKENLSGPFGPPSKGSSVLAGVVVFVPPKRGFVSMPPTVVDGRAVSEVTDCPKRGFVKIPLLVDDVSDGKAVEVREPKSTP